MAGIKSGAAGCIILIPGLVLTLIGTILGWANLALVLAPPLWYSILLVVASVILYIGVLLISIGAMKFGKYYNNTFPKVTGIIGVIATIIGIVAGALALVSLSAAVLAGAALILSVVALILIGVFLILFGIVFIILKLKIGYSGLSLATGILAIICGATFCSWLLSFVGVIILIPTAILAAYLFLKAKGIPEEEVEEAEVKEVKVKEAKKLAVRPVEEKKPSLKPEEIEEGVYKYVKKHPEGIDVAECAKKLGVSEKDVEKAVKALVKKGKLEMG